MAIFQIRSYMHSSDVTYALIDMVNNRRSGSRLRRETGLMERATMSLQMIIAEKKCVGRKETMETRGGAFMTTQVCSNIASEELQNAPTTVWVLQQLQSHSDYAHHSTCMNGDRWSISNHNISDFSLVLY